MATVFMHITEMLPLPTIFEPDLPPAIESVILKAVNKQPDDRFQTGLELASALRQAFRLTPDDTLLSSPIKPLKPPAATGELQPSDPSFVPASRSQTPTGITCSNCRTVNETGQRFCVHCGQSLQKRCPTCYTQNGVDAVHCHNCGRNLHSAEQQRAVWMQEEQKHLDERKRALQQAKQTNLQRLLQKLGDEKEHDTTIYLLRQYGEEAVEPLVHLLKVENVAARYGAIKVLAEIGDKRAIFPIIACLQDDQPIVRYWAVDALLRLKADTAVPALGDLMQDKHPKIREHAAKALTHINTAEAQAILKSQKRKWWPF